jgi:hypothetical protein
MTIEEFGALSDLLGCYFHQDWPEEFDNDMSALQAILDSEPGALRNAGVREIVSLLASARSEDELRDVLVNSCGCYFEPDSRHITYREWLQQVHDKLMEYP